MEAPNGQQPINGKERTPSLVLVDGSHHRHIGAKDRCRWVGGDFRFWLQADLQPPEIDFRLYEALVVKVVVVCVA